MSADKPDFVRAFELATKYKAVKTPYGWLFKGLIAPALETPDWEWQVLNGLERQRIQVKYDFCADGHVHVSLGESYRAVEYNAGHRAEALCEAVLQLLGGEAAPDAAKTGEEAAL